MNIKEQIVEILRLENIQLGEGWECSDEQWTNAQANQILDLVLNTLTIEKKVCPKCGGACQEVVGENIVSMDMAIDAGDRNMAGMHHSYEYAPCDYCQGSGECPTTNQIINQLEELKSKLRM